MPIHDIVTSHHTTIGRRGVVNDRAMRTRVSLKGAYDLKPAFVLTCIIWRKYEVVSR